MPLERGKRLWWGHGPRHIERPGIPSGVRVYIYISIFVCVHDIQYASE